ncbi:PP2C family serine/threonine-protein phosphatase [Phenylobacterium sp.]|uniref:PP2C family protein-serine/threonine phosphatase n=1 Tax=Phenylobacterium sp. TaxID=1871053 RepID=UPI0035B1EE1C
MTLQNGPGTKPNRRARHRSFRLSAAGVSWVGLVRRPNEDVASVNGERVGALAAKTWVRRRHVLLVADGIGGHAGGEVASDLAVRILEAQAADLADREAVTALVQAANRRIYEAADRVPELRGMGTTIAAAVASAAEVLWVNAGDSRIYLVTRSGLRRLSVDHAIGSALTQALGGADHLTEVVPASGVAPWGPGDRILLCSDGLTDVVDDAELEAVLQAGRDDVVAARDLLRLTRDRGAPDNVTLLIATNQG